MVVEDWIVNIPELLLVRTEDVFVSLAEIQH
jgi:hypothetical protein